MNVLFAAVEVEAAVLFCLLVFVVDVVVDDDDAAGVVEEVLLLVEVEGDADVVIVGNTLVMFDEDADALIFDAAAARLLIVNLHKSRRLKPLPPVERRGASFSASNIWKMPTTATTSLLFDQRLLLLLLTASAVAATRRWWVD